MEAVALEQAVLLSPYPRWGKASLQVPPLSILGDPGDPRCPPAALPARHPFPSLTSHPCISLRAPGKQTQLLRGTPLGSPSPGEHLIRPPKRRRSISPAWAGGARVPRGGCPRVPGPGAGCMASAQGGRGREGTRNSHLTSI